MAKRKARTAKNVAAKKATAKKRRTRSTAKKVTAKKRRTRSTAKVTGRSAGGGKRSASRSKTRSRSAKRTPAAATSTASSSRVVERRHVGDFVQDLIDFDGATVLTCMALTDQKFLVGWTLKNGD